jgi:aminomethyltransferase
MAVLGGSDPIGEVTSGCLSPTFGYPIAMALVDSTFSGNEVEVDFGKNTQPASVTPLPFYRRKN